MFGIGFSQILLIALVALIVIGPERLPKVARALGVLFGRAQRFAREVKTQVEQDLHLEEIKQAAQEAENSLRSAERSVQEQVAGAEKQIQEVSHGMETELQSAAASLKPDHAAHDVSSQAASPSLPDSGTQADRKA